MIGEKIRKMSGSSWFHAGGAGSSLGLMSLIGVCGGVCSASALPIGAFLASLGFTGAALWLDAIRIPLLIIGLLFFVVGMLNLVKKRRWWTASIFGLAMTAGLVYSVRIVFFFQGTKSVPLSEIVDVEGADEALSTIDAEALRTVFNRDREKVRLVSLLSPACGGCVAGHESILNLFKEKGSKNMVGHIVWLPMVKNDNFAAAISMSKTNDDRRITDYWDPKRVVGDAFTPTLSLDRTAWDVYMIYEPGIIWEQDKAPPAPTFWMHQLWGVSRVNFLNETALIEGVNNILKPIDGA